MSARARRRAAAVGLLLTLLLVLPTSWAGPAPALAAAPPADPPAVVVPPLYLEQPVSWQRCDFDLYVRDLYPRAPRTRCATLVVPMDWRHPAAHPDITLAVALSRATGTSKGLLTVDPADPGSSALDAPALYAADKHRLFTDFDLLGVDPRGFGQSQQASCPASSAELDRLPAVVDHRVRSVRTRRAEVAEAQLLARACRSSELAGFLGSEQQVADLEFVRAYLERHRSPGAPSYERLNYLGFSYGSWVGARYADAHPEHTGRVVLDSGPDWTSSLYTDQLRSVAAYQRRRDQMFFPWLARQDRRYHLGRTSAAVRRRYEQIRTGVARAYAADLSPVPAQTLDEDVAALLLSDADFPDAAATLRDYAGYAETDRSGRRAPRTRTGSTAGPAPHRLGSAPSTRAAAGDEDVELDAALAVRCADSAYPRAVSAVLDRADTESRRHPFVGYRSTVGMCSYWSSPVAARTVDLAGAPPVLMVQSEGDPVAAYEGALAAHRRTAGRTRLVSVADSGEHQVYLSGVSPCADRLVDGFLFAGRLPADTTCAARPLPRESTVHPLAGPVPTPRR